MSQLTAANMEQLFEDVKNWDPDRDAQGWPMPIHQRGIVAVGLHLLDNLRLDTLMAESAKRERWEFFFVISPLRVARGTGSPVNPVAFF